MSQESKTLIFKSFILRKTLKYLKTSNYRE